MRSKARPEARRTLDGNTKRKGTCYRLGSSMKCVDGGSRQEVRVDSMTNVGFDGKKLCDFCL